MDVEVDDDDWTLEAPAEDGNSSLDTPEQRKLREQIAFHVAQAVKLARDLNSRNPLVTKLPPEILAEVFLCQAAIVRKERVALHVLKGENQIHKSFYQWLNVAQVCHHWREIALNCANLWTWVAFEERIPMAYIQNIVKRARGLPLTVILTVNSPGLHCDSCIDSDEFYHQGSCALELVKELLPRIRELLIFVEKEFDTDNIWESLDEPAPLLETLRVEAMSDNRFQQSDTHSATVRLPKTLFGLQAPKLHSIYAAGIRIHFSSPIFGATIRKLTIVSCQCSRFGFAPDFVAWQSMLRRMPLLEELDIDWSVPSGDDGGTHDTVALPSLKLFRISADLDAFVRHVTHLKFPSTTCIHYHYTTGPSGIPSEELLGRYRAAISTLFKGMSPGRIAYRSYDPEDDPMEEDLTTCQIWASPASKQRAKPTATSKADSLEFSQLRPRFRIESQFKQGMDALSSPTAAALDMSSVRTVDIGDFSMGSKWANVLRAATNVDVVRAHGIAAFGVPAILGGASTSNNPFDLTEQFYWTSFMEDETSIEGHGDSLDTETRSAVEDVDMAEPETTETRRDVVAAVETSAGRTMPLFPNLTTIELVNLDLERSGKAYSFHCPHWSTGLLMVFQAKKTKYGLSIEAILKCLRMRRAKGAADIHVIRFSRCCCADMAQLAPLLEVVPVVFWDDVPLSPAVSLSTVESA